MSCRATPANADGEARARKRGQSTLPHIAPATMDIAIGRADATAAMLLRAAHCWPGRITPQHCGLIRLCGSHAEMPLAALQLHMQRQDRLADCIKLLSGRPLCAACHALDCLCSVVHVTTYGKDRQVNA